MKLPLIAITPLVALIVATVGQVINLKVGAQPWSGEVLLSSTWVWTATYLSGPVLTTVAAWDGARLFPRSGSTVWNRPGVRTGLILRWWLGSTLLAASPALMTLAWMAARFGYAHPEAVASALITLLAGVATLAGFLGAGLALGALLGTVYGTLAGFATSLAAQMVSYLGTAPILMVGGVSDSLLGLRLTWGAAALQTVGLLTLLAAIAHSLFTRSNPRLGPVRVADLGLMAWLVAALIAPQLEVPRFVNVSDLSDGVSCGELTADTRPAGQGEVCMHLQHQRLAPQVTEAWSTLSLAAMEAGVTNFPSRLYELPPGAGPDDPPEGPPGSTATFTMTSDQLDTLSGRVTTAWLASTITSPTWCRGLWAEEPPGDELYEASTQATDALEVMVTSTDARRKADAGAQFEKAWDTLKTCPGMDR